MTPIFRLPPFFSLSNPLFLPLPLSIQSGNLKTLCEGVECEYVIALLLSGRPVACKPLRSRLGHIERESRWVKSPLLALRAVVACTREASVRALYASVHPIYIYIFLSLSLSVSIYPSIYLSVSMYSVVTVIDSLCTIIDRLILYRQQHLLRHHDGFTVEFQCMKYLYL